MALDVVCERVDDAGVQPVAPHKVGREVARRAEVVNPESQEEALGERHSTRRVSVDGGGGGGGGGHDDDETLRPASVWREGGARAADAAEYDSKDMSRFLWSRGREHMVVEDGAAAVVEGA